MPDAHARENADAVKVIILAGGLGTRLAEETEVKPKPMVEVGGRPLLWHILKHYSHYGFAEFFIALGYRGDVVKRYFLDYTSLAGSMTLDTGAGTIDRHGADCEAWKLHLVDTGSDTMTGGRVNRLKPWLASGPFMLTYGDGVADLNLHDLLAFHRQHGRIATITAVRPPSRFGGLAFDGDFVSEFTEKPQMGEGWINGGFMVFEPAVLERIEDDHTVLERDVLARLAAEGQLRAYRHEGFWQCMDTLRDVRALTTLWEGGSPPWVRAR